MRADGPLRGERVRNRDLALVTVLNAEATPQVVDIVEESNTEEGIRHRYGEKRKTTRWRRRISKRSADGCPRRWVPTRLSAGNTITVL